MTDDIMQLLWSGTDLARDTLSDPPFQAVMPAEFAYTLAVDNQHDAQHWENEQADLHEYERMASQLTRNLPDRSALREPHRSRYYNNIFGVSRRDDYEEMHDHIREVRKAIYKVYAPLLQEVAHDHPSFVAVRATYQPTLCIYAFFVNRLMRCRGNTAAIYEVFKAQTVDCFVDPDVNDAKYTEFKQKIMNCFTKQELKQVHTAKDSLTEFWTTATIHNKPSMLTTVSTCALARSDVAVAPHLVQRMAVREIVPMLT
ncbi:hypothetical protein G6011_04835 [Alternaria panax]|uniref:Uncharacterized protein n=1 Tax=Alternaria panax TaxID=48097 RepID=A0AAD4NVA0_9PLEO|nr:hypothetical protein G6011_04835 [Alternaria panax]